MNDFVGQIIILPYSDVPPNFAFCQGQLLPIAEYTALFSLIGTTFGGNGETTFALPDYQGKAPQGSNYAICLQPQQQPA